MKRISLLLVVAALMLFGSVNAFACAQCGIDHHSPDLCAICLNRASGGTDCLFDAGDCTFCEVVNDGTCGALASAAPRTLATQYAVASVERLDEQHPNPSTVKTAHLASNPAR